MTTPAEILDAVIAAGAQIIVEEDTPTTTKMRVRGKQLPPELLATVKANKEALAAEVRARQAAAKDRYQVAPPADAPFAAERVPLLASAQVDALADYVWRQPLEVHRFWALRANAYWERTHQPGDAAHHEADWRACLDVLCWQRNAGPTEALEWLAGLNECAANLPGKNPQISQTDADKPTNQKEQ